MRGKAVLTLNVEGRIRAKVQLSWDPCREGMGQVASVGKYLQQKSLQDKDLNPQSNRQKTSCLEHLVWLGQDMGMVEHCKEKLTS